MSRSNHELYICDECTVQAPCGLHEPIYRSGKLFHGSRYKHKPERMILGRRTWKREGRKCDWLYSSAPGWYRSAINRIARARYNRELRAGLELNDWHKWGSGRIGWFY
jgi:hypothetical protein